MICETIPGRRRSYTQAGWALAMALSAAAALLLLTWLEPAQLPVRALAALVPLAFGVVWVFYLLRDLRTLDELQLRVNLEAAAIGCLGVFVGAILYPVFQHAGFVGQLQPRYVVLAVIALVGAGYVAAGRRYR